MEMFEAVNGKLRATRSIRGNLALLPIVDSQGIPTANDSTVIGCFAASISPAADSVFFLVILSYHSSIALEVLSSKTISDKK